MNTILNIPTILASVLNEHSNTTSSFSTNNLKQSLVRILDTDIFKQSYTMKNNISCYECNIKDYPLASIINLTGVELVKDNKDSHIWLMFPYDISTKRLVIFGNKFIESIVFMDRSKPLTSDKIEDYERTVIHTLRSLQTLFSKLVKDSDEFGTVYDNGNSIVYHVIAIALLKVLYKKFLYCAEQVTLSTDREHILKNLDIYISYINDSYHQYADNRYTRLFKSVDNLSTVIFMSDFSENWLYTDLLYLVSDNIIGVNK